MNRPKAVEMLHNKYRDETCWIVGKGPSLEHLCAEHFGAGPVIALNQSILLVQMLGLLNPIYSVQKDGCGATCEEARCIKCGFRHAMVAPREDVTVILQEPDYSEFCLWEHPLRLWLDPEGDLGFDHPSVMSIRMAIALAEMMGCTKIIILCCDSLVNGNFETFDVFSREVVLLESAAPHYEYIIPVIMVDLKNIAHEFIIPKEKEKLHG